jgi:hypothetical protein
LLSELLTGYTRDRFVADILSLAQRPLASEERRREMVAKLEEALAEAKNGITDTLVILVRCPDGGWSWDTAGEAFLTDIIGRVEILKHEMVTRYIQSIKPK